MTHRHRLQRASLFTVLCLATASVAHAHPQAQAHLHGFGWSTGLLHPLTGLDHLLAMLAVGLWAAQCGGRMRWAAPLTFVAVMLAGAVLGRVAGTMPGVEPLIAASTLVLGSLIVSAIRLPVAAGLGLMALFALAHGWAHGSEAPPSGLATYMVGFSCATAALHAVGLAAGLAAQTWMRRGAWAPLAVRGAGAALAIAALFLMTA